MSGSAARTSSSPRRRSGASAPAAASRPPAPPEPRETLRVEDRREEERELLYGETIETIRALAASQDLTQRQLAHRLGVSDARMSRIMSGRENLTLRTLADLGWATGVRFEVVAVPYDDRAGTPAQHDPPAPSWLARHAAVVARRVQQGVQRHRALEGSTVDRQTTGEDMAKGNDSDRYVQPNKDRGGWDVVKEGYKRASAHERTKADAVKAARTIIKNQGGGELRIKNQQGKFIDSDTIKGPKHRESRARDRK